MSDFDLLLVPDTGPEFTRCLKTAALYAERIFCVSAVVPRLVDSLPSGDELKRCERTSQYLAAAAYHEKDFELLRSEGILDLSDDALGPKDPSDDDRGSEDLHSMFRTCTVRYEVARSLVRSGKVGASFLEEMGRNKAMRISPPAAWHVLHDVALTAFANTADPYIKKHLAPKVIERFVYDCYTKALINAAESNGLTILTYSDVIEQSLSDIRRSPLPSDSTRPDECLSAQVEEFRRKTAGNKLAHRLLSRRLPRVDDLPLEEIIGLRRKHTDQIDAFRVGLAEAAAGVDISKKPERDDAQIEQLIRTKVDPAVADLKAAIQSSRLDLIKNLYATKETAAAATVSLGLSYVAHGSAPANVAAGLITTLFPVLTALLSRHLERKRVMATSRWSLLIELDKAGVN